MGQLTKDARGRKFNIFRGVIAVPVMLALVTTLSTMIGSARDDWKRANDPEYDEKLCRQTFARSGMARSDVTSYSREDLFTGANIALSKRADGSLECTISKNDEPLSVLELGAGP